MAVKKELSIFIDESGDLGEYNPRSPFYIVSLVFHEQDKDILKEVKILDEFLLENKLQNQAIHTAPLIRREGCYKAMDVAFRYKIFKKIFNFSKNVEISYKTIVLEKCYCKNRLKILSYFSNELFEFFWSNFDYFRQFDNIIVYYDDGQHELSDVITAIFGALFGNNFDYRHVNPINYKLFQTADLMCTLSMIYNKLKQNKKFTKSEQIFFGSEGKFKKNFIKTTKKLEFNFKKETLSHA